MQAFHAKLVAGFGVLAASSPLPAQVAPPDDMIMSYAECAGATDGYHIAAAPYMDGTLLIDLHKRDMDALRNQLTAEEWAEFQRERALGQAAWEARVAILSAVPMDSTLPEPAIGPTWSSEATWAYECGQLRMALVTAGILPD